MGLLNVELMTSQTQCFHVFLNVAGEEQKIMDMTETNLVGFRRTVYLTIQSSLDFEECAHKLLKMDIKPGWEVRASLAIVFHAVSVGNVMFHPPTRWSCAT